jgi:HAD superfamily hydrolase (TIGR01490 family)
MIASFFDLDGTLVKGSMLLEFSRYLTKKGLFRKEIFEKIDNCFKLCLENKMNYRDLVLTIPGLYSNIVRNLEVEVIRKEANNFIYSYTKEFLQPYTKELVKLMKGYGITIGISGSPFEVVDHLRKILDFDIVYGTTVEIADGIYTGKIKQNMAIKETKETILEKLISENKIDLNKSFGFGDTIQDLSILSKVGNPVVLNPDQELLSIARKNNWIIFSSEDDVVEKIKKVLEENM